MRMLRAIIQTRCEIPLRDAAKDLLAGLGSALLAMLAVPDTALAYVDPSVMTYAIQALAGVAVALGAVAGVAFRRTRKALMRMFHVEEHANKIVEADLERVPVGEAAPESPALIYPHKTQNRKEGMPGWGWRFGIACIVSLFAVATGFFVPSCETVLGNAASLSFELRDVWVPIALFSLALAAVLSLALSLFRGRAFPVLLGVVFALGLAMYLQAMLLNSGLPTADGREVDWSQFAAQEVTGAVVWICVVAACVALAFAFARKSSVAFAAVSLCLIVVQGIGVASLLANQEHRCVVTDEGLFTVSSQKNVIMFVLDTVDTQTAVNAVASHPEDFAEWTGFTFFRNSTGSMVPTRYGIPFLLTGRYPEPGKVFGRLSSVKDAYAKSTFLQDVGDAGYSIGLYSNSLIANSELEDVALNIERKEALPVSWLGTISSMLTVSLYREAPWLFKESFRYYTDEVNQQVLITDADASDQTPYVIDDVEYYRRLAETRLSTVEDAHVGAFRFIHLAGAHSPYTMDENCERQQWTGLQQQVRGAFRIVTEYLNQLKALGLYDGATIIVTADHGFWNCENGPLTKPAAAMLFVKPAMEQGSGSSMTVSRNAVAHCDIIPTILQQIGVDPSAYGDTVFIAQPDERPRYYLETICTDLADTWLNEYVITGDVLDFRNWRETGRMWEIDFEQ